MRTTRIWSLKSLSDELLDREYAVRVRSDRASTAELLLYLGEMEARKRYVPAGYSSMFRFCVECGRMSEDIAYKRIRAARLARRFPAIYDRIADGRMTLSALVLLAPQLTEHAATRLLADAENKTNEQVKLLLAALAPRPDIPTTERPRAPREASPSSASNDVSTSSAELAVRPVAPSKSTELETSMEPLLEERERGSVAPEATPADAPPAVAVAAAQAAAAPAPASQRMPRSHHAPLSPTSMYIGTTLPMPVYEQLQEARELLSHRLASRELSEVLEAMLVITLPVLRKQKFAESAHPRSSGGARHEPSSSRRIPAHVKREVWERDGGRCTFVGTDGHRCTSRERIEFDHRVPVTKGGAATVENVRLLCHAHNQHEAEQVLGEGFMKAKRAWSAVAQRGHATGRAGNENGKNPANERTGAALPLGLET